jgi:hypothetical protein
MFDDNARDKLQYLGWAAETALKRTLNNHVSARKVLAGWIAQDRRFDGIDAEKLARRIDESRSNGAHLDLTDPRLRGEPARPLTRDGYW